MWSWFSLQNKVKNKHFKYCVFFLVIPLFSFSDLCFILLLSNFTSISKNAKRWRVFCKQFLIINYKWDRLCLFWISNHHPSSTTDTSLLLIFAYCSKLSVTVNSLCSCVRLTFLHYGSKPSKNSDITLSAHN